MYKHLVACYKLQIQAASYFRERKKRRTRPLASDMDLRGGPGPQVAPESASTEARRNALRRAYAVCGVRRTPRTGWSVPRAAR